MANDKWSDWGSAGVLDPSADIIPIARAGANYRTTLEAILALGRGLRNAVIGGDFSTNPWQRGTSFPAIASGGRSADMWISFTQDAVFTITREADAPTMAQAGRLITHSMKVAVTTADAAMAAADIVNLQTRIEGYRWLGYAQLPLTLRFWHKHTKTGTYCISLRNGAYDRSFIAEYTQTTTNTWEEAVIQIPASPSAGTWDYANGTGARLDFVLGVGTNSQGVAGWQTGSLVGTANQVNCVDTIGNIFQIADVRLFLGELPNGLVEVRDSQEELALCQRYLPAFRSTSTADMIPGAGRATGSTACVASITFPVHTRVRVTGIVVSDPTHISLSTGSGGIAATAISWGAPSSQWASFIVITVAGGLTAGDGYFPYYTNASGSLIFTGAELP
jgi:hypothetical protein